jgi:PPOX class probable F420-dependent enzyme
MAVSFDDTARQVLDGKNFAVVATLDRDGSPHTSTVWYVRDGDTVLFSSAGHRAKIRNLERDPRVSLTVYDLANPYSAIDIRGTAELEVDAPRELPARLSQRYLGQDAAPEPEDVVRYIVRIRPDKVTAFSV